MTVYFRPIVQTDRCRTPGAVRLAGGWGWFSHLEKLERGRAPELVSAAEVPEETLKRLVEPRAAVCGLSLGMPRIMGILNATPDSFSDGGQFGSFSKALEGAQAMANSGVDIVDIGGESTRPGAETVPVEEEVARVVPVVEALRGGGFDLPISVDTRKARVAEAALSAGADLFNDVSALSFDERSAEVAAQMASAVCLMHAQGDPATMQKSPHYENVLLDVFDYLEERIAAAEAAGVSRAGIIVDVGIGFGKTIEHNLALLRGISLFHGLGCPLLLGVSRKGFIGVIGNAQNAADRMPGSLALALDAVRQGVQIVRVHDIKATKQALALWQATL